MALGLLDLSLVTDTLIEQFKKYRNTSQLWVENNDQTTKPSDIKVTGLAPDFVRQKDGCYLSIFLFHASVDAFNRNTFPGGGRPQRAPLQPLALTLHYLVTAYSSDEEDSGYIIEQQAMSMALQFFHEHPRLTATVPVAPQREQVVTVTFEPQTMDEIGRLWQGLAQSMRLSAVYRAAVVLLEPPAEPEAPKPSPKEVRIEALSRSPSSTIVVDPGGLATVSATGAGFQRDKVAVSLHAPYGSPRQVTELTPTNANPPPAGAFVVLNESQLLLRVETNTAPHGYQLQVTLEPNGPILAFWLVVSEVKVDREGRAKVRSDGAGFGAATTVTLRDSLTQPAVDTRLTAGASPPGAGEFHVIDGDQVEFQLPVGTQPHGYLLLIEPTAGAPTLKFWLVVP